jgi:hypothetical protein
MMNKIKTMAFIALLASTAVHADSSIVTKKKPLSKGGQEGGGGTEGSWPPSYRDNRSDGAVTYSQFEAVLPVIVGHADRDWHFQTFPVGFIIWRDLEYKNKNLGELRFSISIRQFVQPTKKGFIGAGSISWPSIDGCPASHQEFFLKPSDDENKALISIPKDYHVAYNKEEDGNIKVEGNQATVNLHTGLRICSGKSIAIVDRESIFTRTRFVPKASPFQTIYVDKTGTKWSQILPDVYDNLKGRSGAQEACEALGEEPEQVKLPTTADYQRLMVELGQERVDHIDAYQKGDERYPSLVMLNEQGREKFQALFRNHRYSEITFWTSTEDTSGSRVGYKNWYGTNVKDNVYAFGGGSATPGDFKRYKRETAYQLWGKWRSIGDKPELAHVICVQPNQY